MSKHKGDLTNPTIVYHHSNPIFRDSIALQGLLPMKGDSYTCHSPSEDEPPAIFGCTNQDYDSTYDDDIYRIDTSLCNNTWYKDNAVYGGDCVVTYEAIPLDAIELIYKGTGKDSF
jgi:hypothetical protein